MVFLKENDIVVTMYSKITLQLFFVFHSDSTLRDIKVYYNRDFFAIYGHIVNLANYGGCD